MVQGQMWVYGYPIKRGITRGPLGMSAFHFRELQRGSPVRAMVSSRHSGSLKLPSCPASDAALAMVVLHIQDH